MAELLDRPKVADTPIRSRKPLTRVRTMPPREATEEAPVDLGPLSVFEQAGIPDAEERALKATLVTRLRAVVFGPR